MSEQSPHPHPPPPPAQSPYPQQSHQVPVHHPQPQPSPSPSMLPPHTPTVGEPGIIYDITNNASPYAVRPRGVHTKHLNEWERFRVRTLYYDACMTKKRIAEVTGYSESQIRTAVRAQSAQVGKRSGRPKKGAAARSAAQQQQQQQYQQYQQYQHHTLEGLAPMSGAGAGVGAGPGPGAGAGAGAGYYGANGGDPMMLESDEGEEDAGDEEGEDALDSPSASAMQALVRAVAEDDQPVQQNGHLAAINSTRSSPPRRRSFNDLPQDLRSHIWRLVLSLAPDQQQQRQQPLSLTWPLESKSTFPWLCVRGEDVIDGPLWASYLAERHAPATHLWQITRESRGVVLASFAPVAISLPPERGVLPPHHAVWVDRARDALRLIEPSGSRALPADLLDKTGREVVAAIVRDCRTIYHWRSQLLVRAAHQQQAAAARQRQSQQLQLAQQRLQQQQQQQHAELKQKADDDDGEGEA